MSAETERVRNEIATRYAQHPVLAPMGVIITKLWERLDLIESVVVMLAEKAGALGDDGEALLAAAAAEPGSTAVMTPPQSLRGAWHRKGEGKAHFVEAGDTTALCGGLEGGGDDVVELAHIPADDERCANCARVVSSHQVEEPTG